MLGLAFGLSGMAPWKCGIKQKAWKSHAHMQFATSCVTCAFGLQTKWHSGRAALEITVGLQTNFSKLPSMLKVLNEDATTLKRLVEEETISEVMSAFKAAVEEATPQSCCT